MSKAPTVSCSTTVGGPHPTLQLEQPEPHPPQPVPQPHPHPPHAHSSWVENPYVGTVAASSAPKSGCEPTSNEGTVGIGRTHAKRAASPWYWIWMCASTFSPSITNRMFSPV